MLIEYLGSHEADCSNRPRRRTRRLFPPYAYVPGLGPHPIRSPDGHLYGQAKERVEALDRHCWADNELFLYAVDLYNGFYFWEAHEVWEGIWHALMRKGPVAELLKALIQLAAAQIKIIQDMPRGVEILSTKSLKSVDDLMQDAPVLCGLNLAVLVVEHRRWFVAISGNLATPVFPFLRLSGDERSPACGEPRSL